MPEPIGSLQEGKVAFEQILDNLALERLLTQRGQAPSLNFLPDALDLVRPNSQRGKIPDTKVAAFGAAKDQEDGAGKDARQCKAPAASGDVHLAPAIRKESGRAAFLGGMIVRNEIG